MARLKVEASTTAGPGMRQVYETALGKQILNLYRANKDLFGEIRGAIQYSPEKCPKNCPQKCPELCNCSNSFFLNFLAVIFEGFFGTFFATLFGTVLNRAPGPRRQKEQLREGGGN